MSKRVDPYVKSNKPNCIDMPEQYTKDEHDNYISNDHYDFLKEKKNK